MKTITGNQGGRGGPRPGAGRKKGSLGQRTRLIAEAALANSDAPLNVLLSVIRAATAALSVTVLLARKRRERPRQVAFGSHRRIAREALVEVERRLAATQRRWGPPPYGQRAGL